MGKTAAQFSQGTAYSIGDLVLYEGKLYIFTAAHSAGAWNDADVQTYDASTEQDITRILAGKKNAEKATEYANTVIFSPVQIEGTKYKYVLTNAPDPRI